jgi:hypothetical protein
MFSVIGFVASASASVLTAARATYVSYRPATSNDDEPARVPAETNDDPESN